MHQLADRPAAINHERECRSAPEFVVANQAREASIRQVDGKAGKEPARPCTLARLFLGFQIRRVAFLGPWRQPGDRSSR